MKTPLALAKALVPMGLRHLIRRRHQTFVLRRVLRQLRKSPERASTNRGLLRELVFGWGNPEWSAREEYLAACIDGALEARGPILECGSGLTTLVMGSIAAGRGGTHWALEHSPEWAAKLRVWLTALGLDSTYLLESPLKSYGAYDWYDPPLDELPEEFGFVVCDGPPADTRGGRFGLMPVLQDRLSLGCVVLLDDAERTEEQEIAQRWVGEGGGTIETLGTAKPFMRIVLNRPD